MKTVAEDKATITIQFTRAEAANVVSALDYISSLFEYLDHEALDGRRMTMEEAGQLADEFLDLTTSYLTTGRPAVGS